MSARLSIPQSLQEQIGAEISCEREGNTFRKCTLLKEMATDESITQWSISDKVNQQTYEQIKASKIKANRHIDTLIDAVKENTTYHDRKKIALYIFTKLLG